MRRAMGVAAAVALAWSGGVRTEGADDPLAPFDFLVGSCWTAAFPDGKQWNTHCFTRAEDGAAVVDRHVVSSGPGAYAGETHYRWDASAREITYIYRASDGGESRGAAMPTPEGIDFPNEHYVGQDGTVLDLRGTLIRTGDGYNSVSAMRDGNGWKEMWRMRFTRIGPAPADGTVMAGRLAIEKAIMRGAPAGEDLAGYVAFDNRGETDRLISARCTCADAVELHRIVRAGGDADMRNDWPLPLSTGARTEVRPGSDLHLMLLRTKRPIEIGEIVPIILTFEKAGPVSVGFRTVADSAAAWAER